MKRKVLSLAIAAISLVSFGAAAQVEKSCGNVCAPDKECVKADAPKCKAPKDKKLDGKCCRAPKADRYAGINLSEEQKSKLASLDSIRRESRAQKAKADMRGYLEEVKTIMTPDQYVVYLENLVVNPARPAGHGKAMMKQHKRAPKDSIAKMQKADKAKKDFKGDKKKGDSKSKDKKSDKNNKSKKERGNK